MKTKKLFALLIVAILICALPVLAAPVMMDVEDAGENTVVFTDNEFAQLNIDIEIDLSDLFIDNQNMSWSLSKSGTLTITGTGAMPDFSSSDVPWSEHIGNITNVVIEDGVTSIGDSAFSNCYFLSSITIPDSVTSIGDYAFYYCNLTSIEIPDSVTSIGSHAFECCSVLVEVTFGDNSELKSIGDSAFGFCWDLEGIEIPDSVTSIGSFAFEECNSFGSITIPESVTSIGEGAFETSAILTIYCVKNSHAQTHVESSDYPHYVVLCEQRILNFNANGGTVDTTTMTVYENFNIGTLPVPSRDDYLFLGWYTAASGGKRIISDTIVTLTEDTTLYAHWAGTDIASGTCGESLTWSLGDNTLTISGTGEMYDYDAPWDEYRDSIINVIIEDGVTYIGSEAFFMCANLTDIEMPDSVTSIGDYAFYNCTSLGNVTISGNVTSIGASAFSGCTNVKLLCNYKSYAHTFADANSVAYDLLDVDDWGKCGDNVYWKLVDGTLTLSGTGATYNYENYSNDYSPFYNMNATAIVVEDGITGLGKYIFGSCNATSVVLPDTLESIGESAFRTSDLTSVTISDSVTYIGDYAFCYCYSLADVKLSKNITIIEDDTFLGCGSLGEIIIPDGVTSINFEAFADCTSLEIITIPASVKYISSEAFDSSNNVTINGYSDSYAETYAKSYSIPFVRINKIITYNANSGTNAPEKQIKYDDVDATISEDVPERVDYTFLGWATSADATVPEYFPGDVYSVNEDLTLYAVWESNFGEEIFFTDFNADTVIVRNMGTSTAPSIRFLDGVTENLTMTDNDTAYVWDNTNGYVTTNAGGVTTPVLGLNVTFADKGLYTVKFDYLASDVNVTAIKVLANASEHTVLVTTTGERVNVVSTFMLGDNLSSVSIGAVFADAGDSTASFDNIHVYREDVTNPVTYPGASIRALDNNKLGIRFMASVMHEVWDDDNSEVGFIIARKSVLGDTELAFGCGIPTAHGAAKIGDIRRVYQDLEDGVYFTGVLRGIPDGAENEVMVGRPYMKIGDDYYYGDIIERSVLDVALAVRDNEEAYENCTEELKQAIDSMIDKHFPDNESFVNSDGLFGNV